MATLILFFLGAAFGSFLNVVALRYDPEKSLFDNGVLNGRSYCPGCEKTLRWFELIPLVSFVIQRAKCRTCSIGISPRYFFIEIICGLIFILVPFRLGIPLITSFFALHSLFIAVLWSFVLLSLILMTLIDFKWMIIPDELNIFFIILGILLLSFHGFDLLPAKSFLGVPSVLLGGGGWEWQTHVAGLLGAFAFFVFLVFVTRGRGMGIGDVKLAAALGLIFGSPDIIFLIVTAFVLGGGIGALALFSRKKTMKSAIPFGPFLAFGACTLFFFGERLVEGYVSFMLAN